MALTRQQKQKIIKELKEKIAEQKTMLFFDYSNLKAKDLFSFRRLLKKEENLLKVVKKTLFNLALQEKYPEIAKRVDNLEGQLAVIFGFGDEILPAKLLYRFSQEHPGVKILGGFFEGKFQSSETVLTLAQLPSRQELLTNLTASLFRPVYSFVTCLKENLRKLVFILSQINFKAGKTA